MNNDKKTPVNDEKTPVNDKKTPVNDKKTPVNDEKTPVDDKKTPVNDEKTPVNEKKDTVQNTEYQNLLTDFGFKFVFKQERFLIPFLNELLQGHEKIKKVTVLDSEFLGKTKEDRKAVFDIYCENENDEKFLIEMQNLHQYYFLDRSLFYSSFLIQRQGQKGEWDFELKTMYVIGILNFVPKEMKETDEYLYRILLKDDKTGITAFDKLKFIFVSLPKFCKTETELRTPLDYWLYMLKRSQPEYAIDERALKKRHFFSELLEEIKLNKLNKKQMRAYRLSEKDYDKLKVYMSGNILEGREQGFKEGIQQGMQQGRKEGKQEGIQQGIRQGIRQGIQQGRQEGMQESMRQVAISALKLGYTCQDVSALTGLTLEQVTELHKSAALS